MSKPRKTGNQRLQRQLQIIADKNGKGIMDKLISNGLGPSEYDNSYGPHTLIKLSYLNYYLGIFLPIANARQKRGEVDKIIFIDAFSGSGMVKIKDTNYTVLGSTLLAANDCRFDQIISIEIDKTRADILRERCDSLSIKNIQVINKDINDAISAIDLSPRSMILFFIDPEGMEPEFKKFLPLFNKVEHIDVMLNYNTTGIRRVAKRFNKLQNPSDLERMQKMFLNYDSTSDPTEKLIEFFVNIIGKPKGKVLEVHRKGKSIAYYIFLVVRQTQGGSKFLNSTDEFENYLSKIDGKIVLETLNIVMGKQSTLDIG